MKFGIKCKTFVINAPKHIEYLHSLLRDQYGVRFIRKKLSHVNDGYLSPSTKIVFNCTGIAAKTLPGVEDAKVYPTRGQVVLVKAPRVKEIAMIHGNGYETYIIPRPGSKGNVILGGFMQKGVG
jgi:D-amino-acid oxidase